MVSRKGGRRTQRQVLGGLLRGGMVVDGIAPLGVVVAVVKVLSLRTDY